LAERPEHDEHDERTASPGRRESDVLALYRIGKLEEAVEQAAKNLTYEQVALMDLRFIPRAEMASEFIPRHELEGRFLDRDAMAREYVPRAEHESRRDWNVRIIGLLFIVAQVVEVVLLRH
jgi:hypothetical protein